MCGTSKAKYLVPAMKAGSYGLRNDKVLILFPEGERSIDGAPKKFKKGAAILSANLNVPIVPIALAGFHEAWPRGKGFQKFAKLKMVFGEPIYPGAKPEDETAYDSLTTELRQRVIKMWEEIQQAGATMEEIMEVLKLCVVQGVQACNLGVPILAEELERSNKPATALDGAK